MFCYTVYRNEDIYYLCIFFILKRCHDSSSCEPDIYSDLQRRTFIRIQPSTAKVSKSIISLIQHYQWKILTLIVGSSPVWNKTADSLLSLARENGISITQIETFDEPYKYIIQQSPSNVKNSEMGRLLDKTFKHTRSKCIIDSNKSVYYTIKFTL